MTLRKTIVAAAAVACMTLPLSIGSAQARVHHHHHHGVNPVAAGAEVAADTAGALVAGATAPMVTGYYSKGEYGDYDCYNPHTPGCRPYATKDWSHP